MTSSTGATQRYSPLRLAAGIAHPFQLYGTAFKEGRTGDLTALALKTGFLGFDSANYPTAYAEDQAGDAIKKALQSGTDRESLFIQTKFSPAYVHAPEKLPFDATQPIEAQVKESVEQSLKHFGVDRLDSLMLHVPYEDPEDTLKAWRAMESFHRDGRVSSLGVSNFGFEAFRGLWDAATVKPETVQNRFQPESGYDVELRAFLASRGTVYQAFALLKPNNAPLLASDPVSRVADEFGVAREIALYLLVLGLGRVSVVNGTTSEVHMRADLDAIKDILGDEKMIPRLTELAGEFEGLLPETGKK